MKGHFSIEWLSQSSQALCSSPSTRPSNSWDGPSTSGTASESLPGFYGRWRPENAEAQEKRVEPARPGNSSLCASTQETNDNKIIQQHTHASEAGFSSSTEEEETSGYESEGGRSLSPGALKEPAPSASPSTGRRPRTAFTAEQINSLEKAFKRNAYLGAQDKAELCKRLNLSDKQIRNWFQNRRMKLKRTVQDSLAHACQAKVASHMMHYSDLHGFRAAPYPSFYAGVQESATPYGSGFHYGPAAASGGLPSLPVDALYQYSQIQSLPVHPSNPSMMTPYPPYHSHYYSTQ
ncbi:ventrally expressed dharma/bozozok antagonist [Pimephales promelas]|uniref:ventrally expressed dharma/bozozok antagonist n=1 Tax=Pimephales promelas TaxID=90988 RepID=UPI001955812A|nr:ventrally expressed dharma/bozozok antagonist [Pimephales promelas]KAG1971366.1 homeobox expressed in ES cells [Pimephales promelas]